MPVSLFSPLARGFGAWTGELHLAENDKGPGPSLPSLLQDDPYCHHSGVTVKPRAKSAVSAFSAKSARGASAPETRDGELQLPKTYITKKGAIVLFAAPENPADVEPSERDRLFMKRVMVTGRNLEHTYDRELLDRLTQGLHPTETKRKLLKNRHSEYSNQIGSVHRLAQSVLSFGDQEEYDKETSSVSEADKVYLKFLKEQSNNHIGDKHSRPGGNIDMYLNDLLIRSGARPTTAIPTLRVGSSADLAEEKLSVTGEEGLEEYSGDSERMARPSPVNMKGLAEGGRTSPSARSAGKKLSAEKLASSLKSGGFLGRQTIIEEIDSMSEASSRPYTPASSISRPSSRSRPYARPLSGEPRHSPILRQSPLIENVSSELDSQSQELRRESSFTRSNKLSDYSDTRYSSSILSGKYESEAGDKYTRSASRSGSLIGQENTEQNGEMLTNSAEDFLQTENEIQLADDEIQGIVYHESISHVMGETIEAEGPSPVLKRSTSQMGSHSRVSQLRRHSRTSSVQSLRRDSPAGVQVAGRGGWASPSVGEMDYEGRDEEGELYLSEGDQEELMHEVQPQDMFLADEISLLSGGQETFSFDATTADMVPEHQLLVEDPVAQVLRKHASMSSMKSDRPSTAVSSVSQLPESRPQSIARSPSTLQSDPKLSQHSLANADDGASVSKSSLSKSEGKSRVLSQGTESGSMAQIQGQTQGEGEEEEEVFDVSQQEQTIGGEEEEDRPVSAASSHSGVGSVRAESPMEKAELTLTADDMTDRQQQQEAGDDVMPIKDGEMAGQTEVLDEAATEPKETSTTQPSTTEPLPDYLGEVVQPAERAASAAESQYRPPSSYTSSVTYVEDLPPEPAVTEVRITPLSSANRERTTPLPPDIPDTQTPVAGSPVQTREQTQPKQTDVQSSLPKPVAEEQKKPVTATTKTPPSTTVESSAKPAHATDSSNVPKPAEVKKESTVQSKKGPAAKPTHMVENKPEEKAKSAPAKPEVTEKKGKPEVQKKAPAKPEKEKTPAKEPSKPQKETKPKDVPKPAAAKSEEKTAKPAKPEAVKTAKVSLKPEMKEPEKPAAKEFTKVFDITNYDNFEKDTKKAPVVEKLPEPADKPKEEKPKSLVNDTKAEIERLFGAPPVKRETAKEKKDRMRKEMGPRPRKPKAPEEPKPPKKTAEEKELDKLEQKVMEAIGGPATEPITEEGGGLTVEEMELEQQLLQEKLKDAEAKLTGRGEEKKSKGTPRDGKKKGGKKGKSVEQEEDLARKREELREAKRLEKQKRLEEAKRLEEELKQKEDEKKIDLEKAKTKTLDLDSDIQAMQELAEEAERAEENARQRLQETRRLAREERERRRREEQDRKKEEAIRKKNEEKARLEAGRKREQEMLMRLATKEERMRLAEEERRRKEEEEERAMAEEESLRKQQKEEERLEKKKMEEEEGRIAELEREAEEEALAMLVNERDGALMKKREMEEKRRTLEEEENTKRKEYEAEQRRIEEARQKREEEEAQRREEEKRRLMELQRMEEEARLKLKQEMERRREALLRRRDQNIDRRHHLESLKGKQGITKPWVFSYYVHWPRETYEMRMGGPEDKKKGGSKAKSAPAKGRPTHT